MVYERGTFRFVAVSDGAVARYGYSREEFLALTVIDLAPPEDRDLQERFLRATEVAQRPGRVTADRWRHRCKDGTVLDVEITSDDLDLGGGGCRILVCQSAAERHAANAELLLAREQLHASEGGYRLLFEHNPQSMLAYDRETLQIVAVSDAMVAGYGYSREEFLAMTVADLRPPEEVEPLLAFLATKPDGQRPGLIMQIDHPAHHRLKNGTIIDIEVTSDNVMVGGRDCRIALYHDVTQRNRAVAALVVARDQAVEASKMKSAFLASASHEIRTPMSGVIGMTELLLGMGLTDEQREFAEHVARSGEQTLAIANDILDLSKIEAGHLELDITDFDLHETIEETCSSANVQTRAKDLRLDVHIAREVPRAVRGDRRRVQQVLLNLLANAVKFTAAGSIAVRVSATTAPPDATKVRVEVTDSGIGIDPAHLARIFEPFTQAEASTARIYGGTGLGLTISRELVKLMGGTITAQSTPGLGSTFRFELELAVPAADSRPAHADDTLDNGAPGWSHPPLVLIAEDNEVNQIVAARTIERCGCRVHIVGNGHEALEALDGRRFDAVFMDCQMPVMDGYQATAELRRREHAAGGHTPVIAMTAHAVDGNQQACLDVGMDDYITKPIRLVDLTRVLHRWLPSPAGEHPASTRPAAEAQPGAPY